MLVAPVPSKGVGQDRLWHGEPLDGYAGDGLRLVADYADILQKRVKFIAERAEFRNDDDVIPVSGTVATIFVIDANGVVKEKDANLLGGNYFGITKVLSR